MTNQPTGAKNPHLETVDCISARMVELELLEQALNQGRDLKCFLDCRLNDLKQRGELLAKVNKTTTALEELKITVLFPGLRVRPIGPGDDVVVSEQVLSDWLATRESAIRREAILQGGMAEDQWWLDSWRNFGLVMITDEKDVDGERVVYQERKPIEQVMRNRILKAKQELTAPKGVQEERND